MWPICCKWTLPKTVIFFFQVTRGRACKLALNLNNCWVVSYVYRDCLKKAFRIWCWGLLTIRNCHCFTGYLICTFSAVRKWLTLDCHEKRAEFVIPCCVAGVVSDPVSSLVESIYGRHTIFGHTRYHARVISGNHWCPVYCGIIVSPVCVTFDITGASNAKGGSFHVCKYLNISINSRIINEVNSLNEQYHRWRTLGRF